MGGGRGVSHCVTTGYLHSPLQMFGSANEVCAQEKINGMLSLRIRIHRIRTLSPPVVYLKNYLTRGEGGGGGGVTGTPGPPSYAPVRLFKPNVYAFVPTVSY